MFRPGAAGHPDHLKELPHGEFTKRFYKAAIGANLFAIELIKNPAKNVLKIRLKPD